MKTRQNSGCENLVPAVHNKKTSIKATQIEIQKDMDQINGSKKNYIATKHLEFPKDTETRRHTKTWTRNKDEKRVSAVLGLASFMVEIETLPEQGFPQKKAKTLDLPCVQFLTLPKAATHLAIAHNINKSKLFVSN
mmetsp:Transcript_5123/g.7716  ORF Transcript_5123/g.7716 Transcript_5123/m.7716 type:complete len:136 (-) Transcript_5123:19-426(-)